MAIQQINNAGGNRGGAKNQIREKKESNLPKNEPKELPKSSERIKRLKTGTQKAAELENASIVQKRGMRAANLAVQHSTVESGKGNTTKTFG